MRRLLIILLLTLLPLQASWAAVCVFCADQCVSESAQVAAPEATHDEAAAQDDDDGCNRCHLGSAGIAASSAAPRFLLPPHKLGLFDGSTFLDSSHPDRPERPNWTRAA